VPVQRALRMLVLTAALPLILAGCVTTDNGLDFAHGATTVAAHYAAIESERFKVEAVDTSQIEPRLLRQVIDYRTAEQPGTIVVDPHNRYLYLVEKRGKAVRYGVGVGRAGLAFTGTASIQLKKEWPHWTPTEAMITREPKRYAKWAGGMDGGQNNPLGARALYLFRDGKDTRYRIHGTTEPESIGKAVSSGCIRMMNQDIIDLYERVPLHARAVVL
jgi:lipoprotein-anchoring transpeptidase ErfK/SrfK